MKKLTLPLTGAFAIATCAVLVACGGGGGGGGGTPPTIAPTPTPVQTPLAPQTLTATPAGSTTVTTPVTFGAVSNGTSNVISSAKVTLPIISAPSNATIVLSATVPNGVAVPSARNMRGRFTLGVANTPVAYFQLTMSSTVTISMTPAFTVTLPSSVTVAPGNAYLVVLPGSGTWQEVAGPITAANTMTFATTSVGSSPFTLTAGTAYTFAIVTTGSLTIAGPTAAPTIAPTLLPTTSADGWSPSQVATAFQFPVQSGYNGSGQTVVILGDYQPLAADLTAYLNYFGITSNAANFTTVNIDTFTAPGDTTGQGEATLDIETVAGLAPGANVEFYAMPDLTGQSFIDAYTHLDNDTSATVMTASFGGCEFPGAQSVEDPLLAQAAAHGVVLFASSGDEGNECYTGSTPQYSPGPNYPASDPYVVGVGGNENLTGTGHLGSLTSQVAWNDNFFGNPTGQGASGGGVSALFTPPPYQTGIGSAVGRNIPDIAFPSENVAAYVAGAWGAYSGTSWGSPQAAAMAADLNEYCGGSMVTPAQSNPVARFYTAYTRSSAADFLDITSGTNQFAGTTPSFSAVAGYDNVTGLGIPYGMLLASSLCPGTAHTPTFRAAAQFHGIAAVPIDAYGEARDTSMGFVPRGGTDKGERGSASTKIVIVMRATSTLASDEQSVISDLKAAGFTITQTYANHMAIDATAPASVVERYFQTSIHNMDQGTYGMRYANTTPVVLPASIARVTHGALVDNLVIARWFNHRMVPLH